jgi:PKD repeat protein
MLKKLIPSVLTAALALASFGASAQATNRGWCGTTEEQERYFAAHPGAREAMRLQYQQFESLAQAQPRGAAYVTDVTIPVVVHIIHGGGTDNISDRQIASAITQLNADYQKLNGDTASTSPLFRPIAASTGFQFRLAKIDPNGNCTTGITRHYLPNLTTDPRDGSVQAVSPWNQGRYLNIWVVSAIGVPTAGGFVLGYVTPPNLPTNVRDGFVVRHDYFGNQGTSSPSRALSRTATHEIGHYFGLSHPWGQTNDPGTGDCSGTDFVADTPQTDGTFNCNLTYAPCGPIANVQNFMDYAACPTMFTQGQRALMRTILANNRPLINSAANLAATGTTDGYVAPDCAPIAAFGATTNTSVCINTPVTFRDFSSNFSATGGTLTYSWSFPGGNPATATGQTVSVSYPTAGFYSVTETVSNSIGGTSSTQTNIIRVEGPTGGETAPFRESFEDANFPNLYAAPTLRNYETNGTNSAGVSANYRWQRQMTMTAADGNAHLVVANRVIPPNATTTLITPNIDLSGVTGTATLRFSRAYALRTSADNIQLRISFSSDCGTTWSTPTTLSAIDLSTQGLTPIDPFTPTSAASWQDLSVAIPAQFQRSGLFKVRLQLVNGSTQGNNFYLDNLRISNPLGTKADALAQRGIAVYPNPLTRETAVHVNLTASTKVQLRLTDVLGRTVLTQPAKTYGAGQQAIALTAAGQALKAGVYVVHISLDSQTFTSKLNVE